MALGEWLRQVMVETSALKQRASSVARLMASRQLVALRIESATHTLLLVERDSLRPDFMFLAGPKPRITELFRGNAVDLVLERARLKLEADRAEVVAAPWKFFAVTEDTLRWNPFLDASLAVAASVEEQIAQVPSLAHRRRLQSAGKLKLRITRARREFDRFYAELYDGEDAKKALAEEFRDGGALALVQGRGARLLAGALLLTRRRGTLTFQGAGGGASPELTAALELLAFRHAQDLGFAVMDFGFVPSVLTNPLFIQRRQLGCTFVPMPSSPTLMLSVRRGLRPRLFARSPLLTGEAGAFVIRAGSKMRAPAMREFDVPGCQRVVLSAETPTSRAAFERALSEEVPRLQLAFD